MEYKEFIKDNTDLSVINLCLKDGEAELTDRQLYAIRDTLMKEKVIWSVEQGLGKTYLCVAFCNTLLPFLRKNKKKAIICVPSNKLEDFRLHLTGKTFANVITTTGSASDVSILSKSFNKCDFILCTPSAWQLNIEFNCLIYNNINDIYAMVYDEADGIKDRGYMHWIEISKRFARYVAMANGTPLGSVGNFTQSGNEELRLLYNLLYAINKINMDYIKFYRNYTDYVKNDKNGFEVRNINPKRIMDDYGDCFVNFNRSEVGAHTIFDPCNFHRVNTSAKQDEALGNMIDGDVKTGILYRPSVCMKYNIMPMQIGALQKLWFVVNSIPRSNNIIIYARNTDTLNLLKQLFSESAKIPTVIIDGQHTATSKSKLEAEEKFNTTPGCIALTNIEKGSNLGAATNIILYDMPSDTLQYVFRGIRGVVNKKIQIDWIYYPTYDAENMFNALAQMKGIMDLLNRENSLYDLLLQELRSVYPGHERLETM